MLCVMNIQEVVKHLNFIHITHELQSISHELTEKLSLNLRFQNVKRNVDFVIKKCQVNDMNVNFFTILLFIIYFF